MYKVMLWIAIGIVLALVAVFRVPSWPTANSTGTAVHCPTLTAPITRNIARRELDRLRQAPTLDAPCISELEQIASGERLSEARGDWWRMTGLWLVIGIGGLIALYMTRVFRRFGTWFRR